MYSITAGDIIIFCNELNSYILKYVISLTKHKKYVLSWCKVKGRKNPSNNLPAKKFYVLHRLKTQLSASNLKSYHMNMSIHNTLTQQAQQYSKRLSN